MPAISGVPAISGGVERERPRPDRPGNNDLANDWLNILVSLFVYIQTLYTSERGPAHLSAVSAPGSQ